MSGEGTRLIPPPLSDAPTPTVGVDATHTVTIHDTELMGMIEFRTCSYKDRMMGCLKWACDFSRSLIFDVL